MIDLRHGDCLENYTNNLMKQQSMYVEKVMMEYLEKQGYEIKEPYIKCVEEIQIRLINLQLVGLEEKGQARKDARINDELKCIYEMPEK